MDLAVIEDLRFVLQQVSVLGVFPGVHVALDAVSCNRCDLSFGWLAEIVPVSLATAMTVPCSES